LYGGGIFARNCTFTISSTRFVGNKATIEGGAIRIDSPFTLDVSDNVTFTANVAGSRGGAISATLTSVQDYISSKTTVFTQNQAGVTGGALFSTNSSESFSAFDASFDGNTATGPGKDLSLVPAKIIWAANLTSSDGPLSGPISSGVVIREFAVDTIDKDGRLSFQPTDSPLLVQVHAVPFFFLFFVFGKEQKLSLPFLDLRAELMNIFFQHLGGACGRDRNRPDRVA
jgi:predicted outer membrane repeat protein